MKLDKQTVESLLDEAQQLAAEATVLFEENDNSEDMRSMDRWNATARWLEAKLKSSVK